MDLNINGDVRPDSLLLEISAIVQQLNDIFGPTLVSAIAGTTDTKAPIRWSKPGTSMRVETERKLRFAHRTAVALMEYEDERFAKAWFVNSAEELDEMTPVEAINAGLYKAITDSVRALSPISKRKAQTELPIRSEHHVSALEPSKPVATMKDVAERAGVSIKTVSNVVNGTVRVSKSTKERVEVAIKELGYQVNFSARSLRQGRTGMIGLLLPELRVPYFAELADSVLKAAEAQGLTLIIEQTGSQGEHEAEMLRGPRRRFTDGVLFSPVSMDPDKHPELDVDFPLVLLGERVFDPRYDHVTMSNVEAAQLATEHLAAQGCKNIAVLGYHADEVMGSAALRYKGYRQGLEAAGLEFRPEYLGHAGRWVRSTGKAAMQQILDTGVPIDGVFAMNDALALGALPALRARGLRVPQDVLVVGFDDIDDAQYSDPPLSSVDPGRDEIATKAVSLLVDRIAGGGSAPQRIFAGFSMVQRESSQRK